MAGVRVEIQTRNLSNTNECHLLTVTLGVVPLIHCMFIELFTAHKINTVYVIRRIKPVATDGPRIVVGPQINLRWCADSS